MRLARIASLGLAVALTACGAKPVVGSSDGGTKADGGSSADAGPMETFPAFTIDAPQVVNPMGGPVLTAPRIVPVFFANDDQSMVAQIADFEAKVGATNYWKTIGGEYGVGPAMSTDPFMSTDSMTGTVDDTAIQAWLVKEIQTDNSFPQPDENTVYSLHFPAGVTITESVGGGPASKSCQQFGGYHANTNLDQSHGGVNVAYAVIPRCNNFGGLNGIDAVTSAESHELIEASTDPYPLANPAYSNVDDAHAYWGLLGGGEVGDLCAQDPAAFQKFPELPYVVQRTWSNKAVLAGHDPCVPALPDEVFFNAFPVVSDTITFNIGGGQTLSMEDVSVPQGQTKTIPLKLYSDGPTNGPWHLQVMDLSQLMGGGGRSSNATFSLDKTTGENGQTLNLTITTTQPSQYGADIFFLVSNDGVNIHTWMGLIGQQ